MQNLESAEYITLQLLELSTRNNRYQIQRCRYFFDYSGVIHLLDQAIERMEDTLQAEFPDQMPPNFSQEVT